MADTPRETYGTSDERHACPRCVHGERYEHAEWCTFAPWDDEDPRHYCYRMGDEEA